MKKVPKMINRCKFLNVGLNICGITNGGCPYMADPPSCPTYDESFHRDYVDSYKKKSPTEIAQLESQRLETEIPSAIALSGDIEDANAFADHIEAELNGRGIKVERTEEVVEEAPDWF